MVDLHTHSNCSDGSDSPQDLLALAKKVGLRAIALTDHNTTKGLQNFLQAAKKEQMLAIPGAEITSERCGKELHILALCLPEKSFTPLEEVLQDVQRRAEEGRRNLVDRLRKDGYSIDYDAIQKANPNSLVNRAHIALALQEAGYVTTVQEAFQTLLREGAGYYIPAKRLDAREAIRLIQDLGAIPVWAHPFLDLTLEGVKAFLPEMVDAGLVGMETIYTTYTPQQSKDAQDLAESFHLKPSGGSDYHGRVKPDVQLGVGYGNLSIPDEILRNLIR